MSRKDILTEEVEVWPDNWGVFNVFEAMGTQWRTGAFGATGMDYSALPGVIRMCAVPAGERQDVFNDFRIMESEALSVMAELRECARRG